MAAPKFSPVDPTDHARSYSSPDSVPESWTADRPGDIEGFQPQGARMGAPGPDQGFALKIANELRPKLVLAAGENGDDVVRGCLGVALRRASMFSRAPVVHDVNIAFTIWGFYDDAPPEDLLDLRRDLFEGLRHVGHHYTEARLVADMVPIDTLKMAPSQVDARYPAEWRSLVGA